MRDDVSITMIYPIMKTLLHMGFKQEEFFRFAQFDPRLMEDPEVRISASELERLMELAQQFTGDDYIGLHQGKVMEFADLGIVGYVMMHCATVQDALLAFQRYHHIVCSGLSLLWQVEDDKVLISIESKNVLTRHCIEDMMSSLLHIINKLVNKQLIPFEVRFEHTLSVNVEPYQKVFGCTPSFQSSENVIVLDKSILQLPALYADEKLKTIFEDKISETDQKLQQTYAERVYQWILEILRTRIPSLQEAAAWIAMSTRSLQSKLKQEGTTFQELVAKARQALALRYLNIDDLSIAEVAFALHFTDQSAFHHAFKKWMRVTPSEYSKQMKIRPQDLMENKR